MPITGLSHTIASSGQSPLREKGRQNLNNKELVITPEGLKALEDELEQLKTVKRREVAEKIKIARGFGDLSENSEYDEAKNEQGLVESRIIFLEKTLKKRADIGPQRAD